MYADYYQCYGPGTGSNINGGKGDPSLKSTCFSPTVTWETVLEHNEHLQNEFRLSTPDDWRLRGLVGAYVEDDDAYDQTEWIQTTMPASPRRCAGHARQRRLPLHIGTLPGATVGRPGVQANGVSFYPDALRDIKQTAFFASLDFDILPRC